MGRAADAQLADDLVTRSIDLQRFTAGERAKVFELLKRMEEDLIDLLLFSGKPLTAAGRADKQRLLRQAQDAIEQYFGEITDEQARALSGLGRQEAEVSAAMLGSAMQGAIEVALPPESYFARLVDDTLIQKAPSATWWKRQEGDVAFRFKNEVAYGLAQSETNGQLIARVRNNVMPVTRNNAAALVQTSVQTVSAEARRAAWEQNTDIIKGIRQISTLDSHTSTVCVAYANAAWKMDAARTPIAPNKLPYNGGVPRHWNCRSVEAPVTRTFRELGLDIDEPPVGQQAAAGGPVEGDMTMRAFLERQDKRGPGFVDNLLGDGRAELWRQGKITLPQLLDQSGRPLTLEQLRERYG